MRCVRSPDGSLADGGQHGVTHHPPRPAQHGVTEAVRREEHAVSVGVQRVLVRHHTPRVVEAPEAARLLAGCWTGALNVNGWTQVLARGQWRPTGSML